MIPGTRSGQAPAKDLAERPDGLLAALRILAAARSLLVEHQRPQLDTLTWRGVRRRRRIDERRVRSEPRPAVGGGIVALQQQRFIGRHFREIEPAMIGIVRNGIGFATPVGIDQIGGDEIVGSNRPAIAHGQRRIAQRPPYRPPQIDDLHAALKELIRLVWQMLANAVWARRHGLIDVDSCCRLSRTPAAQIGRAFDALADGMVEDDDTIRLQRRPDEGFRCGVVDAPHFLIVIEVLDRGRVPKQRKPLTIQRETCSALASVEDGDLMRFRQCRRPGFTRWWIEGIRPRFIRCRCKVVELGCYEGKRFDSCFLKAHGDLQNVNVRIPCWLINVFQQVRARK